VIKTNTPAPGSARPRVRRPEAPPPHVVLLRHRKPNDGLLHRLVMFVRRVPPCRLNGTGHSKAPRPSGNDVPTHKPCLAGRLTQALGAQTLCSLKRSDSKLPVHHIDRENGRLCDVQLTTRSLLAMHSDPRSDLLKHTAHSTSASHLQIPLQCTFRTSCPLDQGESTGVRHGSSKDPQRYPPSSCTQPRRLSKTTKPTTSRNILGPWSMFSPKGTLRSQGLF
jgi:hypothetical protein